MPGGADCRYGRRSCDGDPAGGGSGIQRGGSTIDDGGDAVGIRRVTRNSSIAVALRTAVFLLCAALPFQAAGTATGSAKFIPTFIVYYGGGPTLVAADAPILAKFDLIDIDRFRYYEISPNTWAAVKAINPNSQIYLYEMGSEAPSFLDGLAQV